MCMVHIQIEVYSAFFIHRQSAWPWLREKVYDQIGFSAATPDDLLVL